MTASDLDVAVVGVGRFGALLSRVWQEEGANLAGFVDVDEARLAQVAASFGVEATFTDAGEAMATLSPDAVVIATDEDLHAPLTLAALDAGCHVFVEKPLAFSGEQARAIAATADRSGRHVIVGHISRFAAPYQHLRQAIRRGRLGELLTMRLSRDFSRSWYAAFGDRVHPAWESCIHDVDLAVYFAASPVERVFAQHSPAAGHAAPSVLSALLRFASGVTATVESAWMVPDQAPQTLAGALELEGVIDGAATVIGNSGVIKQRLVNDGLVEWTDDAVRNPDLTLWPVEGGRIGGALGREVAHAMEVFSGAESSEIMPLEEAVWSVEATEALVQSLTEDRPVAL